MLTEKATGLYRRVVESEKLPLMARAMLAGKLARESAALLVEFAGRIERLESTQKKHGCTNGE
jgi:hypothetical protein